MSAAMIKVGLMKGKPISQLGAQRLMLRLPYGCCNGALLGQNADTTPLRGDLLCNRNLRDMTATKPGAWS